MRAVARTEATGRTASAREGAIGPPGCDAPVDSAHERYCFARMNDTAQQKTRRRPENTSCTMGAVSQKTVADLCKWPAHRGDKEKLVRQVGPCQVAALPEVLASLGYGFPASPASLLLAIALPLLSAAFLHRGKTASLTPDTPSSRGSHRTRIRIGFEFGTFYKI